jgi:hypothetical protein
VGNYHQGYLIAGADSLVGIKKVEAKLEDQLVLVEGTAAPSSIVAAIQDTGRDAIIRGSGLSDSELLLRFLFFTGLPC